jgi:uncharacterized DUF497 family protein
LPDTADFDWDDGNRLKCQKHGVSIEEIQALFDNDPLVAPDLVHSDEEDRLIAIGISSTGRRIFVIFTYRDRDERRLIRPVSARYMREKEFLRYVRGSP